MSRKVPRNPAWCTCCLAPGHLSRDGKSPCPDHRGPDGQSVEYTGHDAYNPSREVLSIVGGHYTASGYLEDKDLRVYVCFGYDPRSGFLMRTIDDGKPRETSISESAVGRTYHRVQMKPGAWTLLEMIVQLGRLPTKEEAESRVLLDLAFRTLRWNLLVTEDATLTDRGREVFAKRETLRDDLYLS